MVLCSNKLQESERVCSGICKLFDKTNYNDVKELNSSLLPGLFD